MGVVRIVALLRSLTAMPLHGLRHVSRLACCPVWSLCPPRMPAVGSAPDTVPRVVSERKLNWDAKEAALCVLVPARSTLQPRAR